MIKRLVLIFSIIIFIDLYLFFLIFLEIDIIGESWRFLTDRFGSMFGSPLYTISIVGIVVVSIVAFLLLKISSGKS